MTEEIWIKRWNELNRQFHELLKEREYLQGAYDIAMKEINGLRKKLGYDSQQTSRYSVQGGEVGNPIKK